MEKDLLKYQCRSWRDTAKNNTKRPRPSPGIHERKKSMKQIENTKVFNALRCAFEEYKANSMCSMDDHLWNAMVGEFNAEKIETKMVTEPYATVADGIIDQCKKRAYDIVVIGRKRMSKAQEFVLGDVSVKLVRALEGTAVLVVKSD